MKKVLVRIDLSNQAVDREMEVGAVGDGIDCGDEGDKLCEEEGIVVASEGSDTGTGELGITG
jgi:hypothetical protein